MARRRSTSGPKRRFGIGEWYGKVLTHLSAGDRQTFAALQATGQTPPVCPFQSADEPIVCTKKGGVCTLRLYQESTSGVASIVGGSEGRLCTICPNRFEENQAMNRWVGETILGSSAPDIVNEVGFLERVSSETAGTGMRGDDVGRIDKVLVVPGSKPLAWCALEVQAVYFSGDAMTKEWPSLRQHIAAGIPFPIGRRRPDYRSSGPKRLMPQLQIKVPSLRRWGKKMAVVVDLDFWEALGPMDEVSDVSSCDIAWFILRYAERSDIID